MQFPPTRKSISMSLANQSHFHVCRREVIKAADIPSDTKIVLAKHDSERNIFVQDVRISSVIL